MTTVIAKSISLPAYIFYTRNLISGINLILSGRYTFDIISWVKFFVILSYWQSAYAEASLALLLKDDLIKVVANDYRWRADNGLPNFLDCPSKNIRTNILQECVKRELKKK